MTPIWQAECPECAEEASDELWRAAFEAWPNDQDTTRPFPLASDIFGLSQEMAPSLSQPVCPTRQSNHPATF